MPFTSHPILNLPMVTDEEEEAERAALSEQERFQLQLDVYGNPRRDPQDGGGASVASLQSTGTPSIADASRRLEDLANAIAALPDSEKAAYLEAQELVPELVQAESPPGDFLRRENLDVQAAAVRLTSYWKQRKVLFGSELAFLPLTLDGALRDDIELIEQALFLPLPHDNHNRPVLLWNRAGYDNVAGGQLSPNAMSRLFLFIAHSAGYSNHKGLVILINMQRIALRSQTLDRSHAKAFRAIAEVFPFRIVSVHICTGPGKSVGELLLPVLKHAYGKELRLRLFLHSGQFQEVLHMLGAFGLSEGQVAPLYGAPADRDALMQQWLAEQRKDEEPDSM